MPIDTLIAYVGVYGNVADAEADYQLVKELHTEAGLIDAYDAAVIERRDDGKTKIVYKHETPRVSGACSAEAWASRRVWSSPCSRLRPSAAVCCSAQRPAARSSARWPDTPLPG